MKPIFKYLVLVIYFQFYLDSNAQIIENSLKIKNSKINCFIYYYQHCDIELDSLGQIEFQNFFSYMTDSTNLDSIAYFVISSSLSKTHFLTDSLVDIKRQLNVYNSIYGANKGIEVILIPPCNNLGCCYPTLGESSSIQISFRLKCSYSIQDIRIW